MKRKFDFVDVALLEVTSNTTCSVGDQYLQKIFESEDRGSMLLRNFGIYLQHMVSERRYRTKRPPRLDAWAGGGGAYIATPFSLFSPHFVSTVFLNSLRGVVWSPTGSTGHCGH